MKVSGERYFPRVESVAFAPFEPFISYEHWHRYCYALQIVAGKSVLDIASGEGYGSAFLAAHPEFRLDAFPHPLEEAPPAAMIQLWPQVHDGDARFIARMIRSPAPKQAD